MPEAMAAESIAKTVPHLPSRIAPLQAMRPDQVLGKAVAAYIASLLQPSSAIARLVLTTLWVVGATVAEYTAAMHLRPS
jgi:hypothetical protein